MMIRKATLDDIPELQRLQVVGDLLTAAGEVWDDEWFAQYINRGITLVAECDSKIIGFILGEYLLLDLVICWLSVVDTEYRNGQAALALLNEFKRTAKDSGAKRIILYAIAKTALLHKRMGAYIEPHDFKEVLYIL
jgi:N-acetylglutamate synthase-like GNAT family acetyltransferase